MIDMHEACSHRIQPLLGGNFAKRLANKNIVELSNSQNGRQDDMVELNTHTRRHDEVLGRVIEDFGGFNTTTYEGIGAFVTDATGRTASRQTLPRRLRQMKARHATLSEVRSAEMMPCHAATFQRNTFKFDAGIK